MTFILREVLALRATGLDVITCSIRRPPKGELRGPEPRKAFDETFFVLPRARNPFHLLSCHVRALVRSPTSYLAAFLLSLRTGRPGLKGLVWQLFYFAEAAVLARYLHESGVRHLHNHFSSSSCNVAMITSRMSGIPFSFTVHGPSELWEPRSWKLGEKVARAEFVACISHFARSQVMFFSGRKDWQKLRIVHCGVEPDRYARDTEGPIGRGAIVPGPPGLKLLFVGRLAAVKGLFVLLEALTTVEASGIVVSLEIIGDGEDRKDLEDAALVHAHPVRFLGYQSQEEVAQALRACDALVLPSFAEGVPVVLMEAMASARPVIATRVAGVSELVRDGESGLLVPPGSAAHLAEAIVALAGLDNEARERMGAAGRRMVEAEFDVSKEARKLARLLGRHPADTTSDAAKKEDLGRSAPMSSSATQLSLP